MGINKQISEREVNNNENLMKTIVFHIINVHDEMKFEAILKVM